MLMTTDAVGGVWTYALELARALEPHGVEIALASMGPRPTPAQRQEVAGRPNVTLHESAFALEWMDDPWREVERAGDWLLDLAAAFAPEIVHLNGYVHASLPWGVPVLVAAHSCVFSWWSAVRGEMPPGEYDEYRRRVSAGLAAADFVVAPTTAMLAALDKHYGGMGRHWVIPNAREPSGFSAALKQPQIFSAGRAWDEAKNLAALDAVAPRVSWPVHVAGDARHPNGQTVSFANVRCLGKLDATQMRAELQASAIYALPARYEPFGLSVLEAGLCGCALVLGDIPSLREVWGNAAVFVAPDDEDALAGVLDRLIAEDGLRTELGRRARTRALTYTPARMAARYLAAYRGCLEAQPSEAAA